MARAAMERGYEYLAICDHTPAVGAVRGLTPDDVRRQAEEIAAANELLSPFRVLRGIECHILADGRLDLPDDVLAELDWVQASVHGGQRMPRADMTRRVEAALRNPYVRCLSHPTGRYINRRPENALDLERAFEEGVAARFRQLVGEAPLRYLTRTRLAHAAAMLRTTDSSLTQIAASAGYGTQFSFGKAFKRTFGIAPGAYRGQPNRLPNLELDHAPREEVSS
jgi:AraC-like DNA-binding protein